MPDIRLRIGRSEKIFRNVQRLRVPLANEDGTVDFVYKQGTYHMAHGGSDDISEYATVVTDFQEYTSEMQGDDAEKTAQVESLVTKAAQSGQDVTDTFRAWETNTLYRVGNYRKYNGKIYKCLQEHTSQSDWTPDVVPALWQRVTPGEEYPEWVQPTGAHDAYNTGDKVSHNGKHWVSSVDGNVWEPGVHGWNEV